jgi:hypothetical protein
MKLLVTELSELFISSCLLVSTDCRKLAVTVTGLRVDIWVRGRPPPPKTKRNKNANDSSATFL